MTCSRVERSSGSPPRLPKSLTVRVFWVVDMLDLLSGLVLLMTAGPGPEGEKAGLSRPRAARPEGLALRPGRPRGQRQDACAAQPNPKGETAGQGSGDPSARSRIILVVTRSCALPAVRSEDGTGEEPAEVEDGAARWRPPSRPGSRGGAPRGVERAGRAGKHLPSGPPQHGSGQAAPAKRRSA